MPKLSLNASRKTKHTPAGEIPVDWGCVRLSEVARVVTGATPKGDDDKAYGGNIPFITPGDLNGSRCIQKTQRTLTSHGLGCSRMISEGSTVVVCIGSSIGKCGITKKLAGANQQINAATAGDKLIPGFLYYAISSRMQRLKLLAGKQAVPIVNKSEFSSLPISLPPLVEQRRIAEVLSTWDTALEKLDALIRTKQKQKKALMQQLLTGKRRLPRFEGEWESRKLKELAAESSLRNGNQLSRDQLYAVTKAHGMVPMREQVQGTAINRCKVVREGWFAYNPMRINIGSIARWEKSQPVMVSPDYVVFKTDETRLLSSYLNHLRRSNLWERFVVASGNGSVRVRIWFADLGIMKIPVPPIPEQQAIIEILDASELEIRILKQQRDALDQERKGIMQKLLTGKLRVK